MVETVFRATLEIMVRGPRGPQGPKGYQGPLGPQGDSGSCDGVTQVYPPKTVYIRLPLPEILVALIAELAVGIPVQAISQINANLCPRNRIYDYFVGDTIMIAYPNTHRLYRIAEEDFHTKRTTLSQDSLMRGHLVAFLGLPTLEAAVTRTLSAHLASVMSGLKSLAWNFVARILQLLDSTQVLTAEVPQFLEATSTRWNLRRRTSEPCTLSLHLLVRSKILANLMMQSAISVRLRFVSKIQLVNIEQHAPWL